jgi:raffinose/stachyose/melibiose transport system substrate-binding protein
MTRRMSRAAAATVLVAAVAAGCAPGATAPAETRIGGEITVLTNRTDVVGTDFADYVDRFTAIHPDVTVHVEAIQDYEAEVSARLESGEGVGDVLLVPNQLDAGRFPEHFAPLGRTASLRNIYQLADQGAVDGQMYAVPVSLNLGGLVYNKEVWAAAGVEDLPATPREFLDDLQRVADRTDAVPLYTNYGDGWPLAQWDGNRGVMGEPDYDSTHVARSDTPWAKDEWHGIADRMLFDAVARGLTEPDPTSTDWESSKRMLAEGEIGTMMLGSWAVAQIQQVATDAGLDPAAVGYMPFPYQVDGVFHATLSSDYRNAVSLDSQNRATALEWVEWFAAESGYAAAQQGIAPRIDGGVPLVLEEFREVGVALVALDPPAGGGISEAAVVAESGIDLYGPEYRRRLVDIARGAVPGSRRSAFEELDERWAQARDAVGGG